MLRTVLLLSLLPVVLPGRITRDPSDGEGASDLAAHTTPSMVREAVHATPVHIVLNEIPFTRRGGTRKWDMATGPDLELVLRAGENVTVALSDGAAVSDVTEDDLPLWFSIEADALPMDAMLVLDAADWDATGTDHMFRTEPASPAEAKRAGRVWTPLRTWTGDEIGRIYFELF
jgi:hypothetical protein